MAGPARQWRACWRRWRVLALAAAALGALRVRVPAQVAATHRLPALAPAALAHSLADFSNQPDISSWWVEEDHSNYTTWRYSVSFECGTWCRGRGVVVAADEPAGRAPQHGRAVRSHHLSVVRRDCSALPLLPWPQLCDEVEVRAVVSGASEGDGSQLQWMARAGCGALGWAAGACARRLQRHALALERLLRV